MPIPAVIWSVLSGHGIWYPANLLAGMVLPGLDRHAAGELSAVPRGLAGDRNCHPCCDVDRIRTDLRSALAQARADPRAAGLGWPLLPCSGRR